MVKKMDLKTVKQIIALVEGADIAELEVEQDGLRVAVKKNVTHVMAPAMAAMAAIPHTPAATPSPSAPSSVGESPTLLEIKSPMVGTFYRSPAPDADPFVKVGDHVSPDTVVCILEAMKVMNELKAGVSGTIAETLVENAQPIEYGEVLFRVKPD